MSKLKHTPGPWKAEHSHSGESVFAKGNIICYTQTYADSLLIAAAPEMLEALIELTKTALIVSGGIIYSEHKAAIKAIENATSLTFEEIVKEGK